MLPGISTTFIVPLPVTAKVETAEAANQAKSTFLAQRPVHLLRVKPGQFQERSGTRLEFVSTPPFPPRQTAQYRPKESPAPRERGGAETSEICSRVIGVISGPWAVLSQIKPQAPRIALQCKKRVDPIESQRLNLSGSWHSGRSQHEQYLGYAGSSVQDMPHCRHSKKYDH